MKIDLDWIQEELDTGNTVELECVDRDGFLAGSCFENTEILRRDLIIESVFFGRVDIAGCDYSIVESEFKYFRIKRSAPTFDDLIDTLIKAKKDNIVSRVEIKRNSLNATVNVTDSKITEFCISKDAGDIVIKKRIDWINSLYTETFVIESEGDISRVKSGADIELANGNKCTFLNNDGMWRIKRIKDDKGFSHNCGLLVLKGATVTQQKGNK